MTVQERSSFLSTLPENAINSPRKLYRSVHLLKDAEGADYATRSRVLAGIRDGEIP